MSARDALSAQFARDGYALAPLFAPQAVRAAQADLTEHLNRIGRALYRPEEECRPQEPLDHRLDRIAATDRSLADLLRRALCTDAHRGPRLAALAAAPELQALARHLGGVPLDGQVVRVRASLAAFPQQRHPWHSDVARATGDGCNRVRVTAWIPLDDAGPDRGGLELLPGRRDGPLPHERDGNGHFAIDPAHLEAEAETRRRAGAAVPAPVRPPCPAGSVLFLDRFTPHRTLPAGPRARFALVVWMKAA